MFLRRHKKFTTDTTETIAKSKATIKYGLGTLNPNNANCQRHSIIKKKENKINILNFVVIGVFFNL